MSLFTKHLKDINESYFQHFKEAFYCGSLMVLAGLACITHAIFPFLCDKTATGILSSLQCRFKRRHDEAEKAHKSTASQNPGSPTKNT